MFINKIQNKNVLFITTKNLDYLRNVQEINLLTKNSAKLEIIGSNNKKMMIRTLYVWSKLLFKNLKKYDVVFCGFAPQLLFPLLNIKKKKYLIIDFFISAYDTLVFDRKKFDKKSMISKLVKFIDQKTIESANYIIGDTKTHCEFFGKTFSIDEEKFEVLYLEADNDIYYPREKKRNSTKKNVLYFGSILPLQGIEVILEAIMILEKNEDIHFTVVGPISGITKDEFKNVTFFDWLSQEKLAEEISESDLCLAGHFNSEIQKASRVIPGKAYIYQNMQKPMLLGENLANRELFDEQDKNIHFVEMGSPEKLAKKIEEVI